MDYQLVESNVENLVNSLFQSPHLPQYPYHNLAHTQNVVAHVKEIAAIYPLSAPHLSAVILAAWFHDVGQIYGSMEGHEERGKSIMENYLTNQRVPAAIIGIVANCILATRKDAMADTLMEKIICDADTYHFGTAYFHETEFLIQKEMEMRHMQTYSNWHQGSIAMLREHVYYTEYCQLKLNEGKRQNIAWLESLVSK